MTRLSGRAAFLKLLTDEGVSHLFGNPGTTELPIMEVLPDHPELQFVLGLQESVVLGMADGFARASGRLTAANVHVAPGLGNAMGALYNAKFSNSPIIVTAGQQEQGHGLLEPLLYDPLVPIAQPLVKWAVEPTRVEDLPRILRRAAKVAMTPPTGPVFISLPGDVLDAEADLDLGRPVRIDTATRPSDETLTRLADMLLSARAPVLVAGPELATRDAFAEAGELAELLGAAVHAGPVPYSAQFPTAHPAYLGALTRSQKQARAALEPYDLLFCLGGDLLRMSVYSPVEPLPPGLAVAHVSEKPWELGKNYRTDLAVQADVKQTLRALLPVVRAMRTPEAAARAAARLDALRPRNWTAQRAQAAAQANAAAAASPIDPRYLVLQMCDQLGPDAVVIEEALTSATPLPGFLHIADRQSYYGLASGGLGFGVPGAVGASLALPGRRVTAFIGDGSAMYGIQALWTAAHLKLPITYVIANNRSYRILKDRLVSMRATDRFVGMDMRDPAIDYTGLAQSLGVPARRVADGADIVPALREAAQRDGPSLIEVMIADGYGG
ncbi:MAG TPA: thiamine pyrophosphate-binding protein [Quisquiliibacterium sp.]|nr:thiamine pyrophosphate-binding protein [Quisquiliibacterium sp.]HQD82985.1 thiamine pyrophosphate-binding protein [Quisquiliibacterium sp.]HQN11337.1 thiamine pyrophosphate-binding protein [Quisquiliibacterium sp.]